VRLRLEVIINVRLNKGVQMLDGPTVKLTELVHLSNNPVRVLFGISVKKNIVRTVRISKVIFYVVRMRPKFLLPSKAAH
jgi:hypothetical protein